MFHKGSTVPVAEKWLENLVTVQTMLMDNVRAAKDYQKQYFDKGVHKGRTYEKDDWVWLLRQNIATTRPLTKLDFKSLGPFRVDLPMGNNVYKLILPKDLSRLHPVFHASLLLPYVDPRSFPGRLGFKALHNPSSLNTRFWDKQDVELLLGYRQPSKNVHEYLHRGQNEVLMMLQVAMSCDTNRTVISCIKTGGLIPQLSFTCVASVM
jgi:hypothetical protein